MIKSIWFCSFVLWLIPQWAMALDLDEARHLLLRTGHPVTYDSLDQLAELNREEAVEWVIDQVREEDQRDLNLPEWHDQPPLRFNRNTETRREFRRRINRRIKQVKRTWMRNIINASHPFNERILFFFHNQFTTDHRTVRQPNLLLQQHLTLRQHLNGTYEAMLRAMIHDPALLIYLDNHRNRQQSPNENFARELLELFTLGEGHYTENDVREVARAFTGWGYSRQTGEFRINARHHDQGEKEIFGHVGNWDGDDVIDFILEDPQTSLYLCRRLWVAFISPIIDETQVLELARQFRESTPRYDFKTLYRAFFNSDAFWSIENRGLLIKSPIDYVVHLSAQGTRTKPPRYWLRQAAQLGLDLYNPPNVRGWVGGTHWINASTLMKRAQLAQQHLRRWRRSLRRDTVERVNLRELWLAGEPLTIDEDSSDHLQFINQLIHDPQFQLK